MRKRLQTKTGDHFVYSFFTTNLLLVFSVIYEESSVKIHLSSKRYSDFKGGCCFCKWKSSGRPSVNCNTEKLVRIIRFTLLVLVNLPSQPAENWTFRSRLCGWVVILSLQSVTVGGFETGRQSEATFCVSLETDVFMVVLMGSDEATFHLSNKVHKHNIRIWGMKKKKHVYEEYIYICATPQGECVLRYYSWESLRPRLFRWITWISYLDMLRDVFFRSWIRISIFQQDNVLPPYFYKSQ